jgi:Bromodomain
VSLWFPAFRPFGVSSTSFVSGRLLGPPFYKKVPKRTYPDYYEIIQFPIAFDDIKAKLDKAQYPTLEAVKQDLELCFNNAMLYNAEGSEIWADAKDLMVRLTFRVQHRI